ncbi:MAG: methyltransferase, partial [Nanoarchaeota archaeon]|nr:methyltransferase [Nanoarchaeota archaeon]
DESMNNVKNARINSQMAKINISIGKAEIDWLDTKFEKHSVDRIITNPPFPARHKNKAEVEKTTKELLNQAKYVLKPEGLLVTVTQDSSLLDQYAKENSLKLIKKLDVSIGDLIYKLEAFKP